MSNTEQRAFTPGPWWRSGNYVSAQGHTVAMCPVDHYDCPSTEEIFANARLIAAAPDMLAALKVAEAFMEIASDWNIDEAEINGEKRSTYDWLDVLREAIAKAEGSS